MVLRHELVPSPAGHSAATCAVAVVDADVSISPPPVLLHTVGSAPQRWQLVAKSLLDLVIASVLLFLMLPVLIATAIAIKVDSPGPVLFRQERVGHNGQRFRMWKLRTMTVDAEDRIIDLRDRNESDGPLFKIRDDPRITRIGRVLRRTSLDELPQLVNVLRGEMSMVGPRPALANEMAHWPPELFERLRVKPGMTGAWQVNGRGDRRFETYARLDLDYVEHWSLARDLAILVHTVPTVVLARGSY